jgi:hypothetical protein
MLVKIAGLQIDDCKEVVVVYWDTLENLKVYVNSDGTVFEYPYTHRMADSYMASLEVILEEYPDYISFVKDNLSLKVEDFKLNGHNFLLFIDTGFNKLFFSTLAFDELQKKFSEIKRLVIKGIRVDVR